MTKASFCVILLAALLQLNRDTEGATYDNLDTLTTNLFSSYKVELRPFVDDSNPTSVYMGIWLASVQDLNEIDQSLTFSAFLYLEWKDPRLQWDPKHYNGTHYFAYPQTKLWIPDVTIINSMETMAELGFNRNYLYIIHTGEVMWLPGGVYKTSCDIDITYYPFDTQTCVIIFSTLVSKAVEIDLEADQSHSVNLDMYSPSGTWELKAFTTAVSYDTSDKTRVAFQVKLKRLSTYYVVSIIFPVLFLSLTATLVFALPADSGEKMGTSITVLLAFAVYLTIVADQMPKTSLNLSVLSLYLSTLLGQTAIGVLLSVWILNLHFRDDDKTPPGRRLRSLAVFMQRIMCKRPWKDQVTPLRNATDNGNGDTHSHLELSTTTLHASDLEIAKLSRSNMTAPFCSSPPTTASSSPQEMMSWREVSFTFDRFLFYTFTLFLTLATCVFLIILVVGGNASS